MVWILIVIIVLCVGGYWLALSRQRNNPLYLGRSHFKDLKRSISTELRYSPPTGIPSVYIERYEKLTHVDFHQFRLGITQLERDMKCNGIDPRPIKAMIKSIIDNYYDD